MLKKEIAIVWLDSFDFMSYKKKQELIELFDDESEILSYEKLSSKRKNLKDFLKEEEIDILLNNCCEEGISKVLNNFEKLNIIAIANNSSKYPKSLINIDSPPFVLYCKGNIDLLKKEGFAVVGSRHITNYGKQVTEKFTKALVEAGFTIVSGLADGVDTMAHATTVKNNGKTIAVLAGGLDEIYPKSNTNLARLIIESGGLIVSETKPYRRTESFMFPIRNRIIAALSKGVLITEAQEKSGVIHTKNYALDYGKDVFCVPGSVFSSCSVGSNRMIVNGQAKAVCEVDDILSEYNIKMSKSKVKAENFSIDEAMIINCLKTGEKSFEELIISTNFETKTLNSLLTTLCIRGIIKKLAGNIYYLV